MWGTHDLGQNIHRKPLEVLHKRRILVFYIQIVLKMFLYDFSNQRIYLYIYEYIVVILFFFLRLILSALLFFRIYSLLFFLILHIIFTYSLINLFNSWTLLLAELKKKPATKVYVMGSCIWHRANKKLLEIGNIFFFLNFNNVPRDSEMVKLNFQSQTLV